MPKSNKKISKIFIISLFALLASNILVFFLIKPTFGQSNNKENVLIVSKRKDKLFIQNIGIDQNHFNISLISDSTQLESIGSWIDAIILFDVEFNTLQ